MQFKYEKFQGCCTYKAVNSVFLFTELVKNNWKTFLIDE